MDERDSNIRVTWKVHLEASPDVVYKMLATDTGRAQFWAEEAQEQSGTILFLFPNGVRWQGEILEQVPGKWFAVHYYGGSRATFMLASDGAGGTDLTLVDEGINPAYQAETMAGWVSVLLALKAAVNFGVDLRNHDPDRTWDQGYVGN